MNRTLLEIYRFTNALVVIGYKVKQITVAPNLFSQIEGLLDGDSIWGIPLKRCMGMDGNRWSVEVERMELRNVVGEETKTVGKAERETTRGEAG